MTWRELEAATNRAARALRAKGVDRTSLVAVALPNGTHHIITTVAVWKLGATALPLDPVLTSHEFRQLVDLAKPRLVVSHTATRDTISPTSLTDSGFETEPLSQVGLEPRSAALTGGTTGLPKVIARPDPWIFDPDIVPTAIDRAWGMETSQIQLVVVPLHHWGFGSCYYGLFLDHTLVVAERFIPRQTVDVVKRHGVEFVRLVPTMMRWISQLDGFMSQDFSTVRALQHGTGSCPPDLKRTWIDIVGPTHIFEGYGSQERVGNTLICGDEWLRHPGSLGRPHDCDLRILDEEGKDVPPGVVGEIFLRRWDGARPVYVRDTSTSLRSTPDGFFTVGDFGRVDQDGYLYLAGRRESIINVGGAKVYPAEVEQVLTEHEQVADAAVVGIADPDLGERVHAFVAAVDPANPPDETALARFCRERLRSYKIPNTYELVDQLPRNAAGKLLRRRLPGR